MSYFGATATVVAEIWNRLVVQNLLDVDSNPRPRHLLWSLLWLRQYNTEKMNRLLAGIDEKTYREWSWYFVELIRDHLEPDIIRWENRFENWNQTTQALVAIDGTDCPIQEPYPFDSANYSEKFNGPGVKYVVATSIFDDGIVFISRRNLASTPEPQIFDDELASMLCEDEVVETDMAGKGKWQLKNPRQYKKGSDRICKRIARAQQ
jgi:hypothetical protein